MTADEIREEYQSVTPCYQPADEGSLLHAQVRVLAEIAAQLAELNQFLRAKAEVKP